MKQFNKKNILTHVISRTPHICKQQVGIVQLFLYTVVMVLLV